MATDRDAGKKEAKMTKTLKEKAEQRKRSNHFITALEGGPER